MAATPAAAAAAAVIIKSVLVRRRPRPLTAAGSQLPVCPAAGPRSPGATGRRAAVAKATAGCVGVPHGVAAVESSPAHLAARLTHEPTQGKSSLHSPFELPDFGPGRFSPVP